MPRHDEEEIVRESIKAISRIPHTLVMRNEANALTAFFGRLLSAFPEGHPSREVVQREYQRIHPSKRYGLGVGSSDLIVCARGRFIGLECKRQGGSQSEEQVTWEGWVERAWGSYEVVRSAEEAVATVERVID